MVDTRKKLLIIGSKRLKQSSILLANADQMLCILYFQGQHFHARKINTMEKQQKHTQDTASNDLSNSMASDHRPVDGRNSFVVRLMCDVICHPILPPV